MFFSFFFGFQNLTDSRIRPPVTELNTYVIKTGMSMIKENSIVPSSYFGTFHIWAAHVLPFIVGAWQQWILFQEDVIYLTFLARTAVQLLRINKNVLVCYLWRFQISTLRKENLCE